MEKIEINDAVIHVPEGVCTVTSIIERDLASLGIRQYYVLEPVYDHKSKIFVPIEGNNTKVRELPNKEEVLSFVSSRDFDVLIILGAGDLDNFVPEITKIIKEKE